MMFATGFYDQEGQYTPVLLQFLNQGEGPQLERHVFGRAKQQQVFYGVYELKKEKETELATHPDRRIGDLVQIYGGQKKEEEMVEGGKDQISYRCLTFLFFGSTGKGQWKKIGYQI